MMLEGPVLPKAVTYHSLSDDELMQYSRFAGSENGKTLHDALINVVWQSLTETYDNLGEFFFLGKNQPLKRSD